MSCLSWCHVLFSLLPKVAIGISQLQIPLWYPLVPSGTQPDHCSWESIRRCLTKFRRQLGLRLWCLRNGLLDGLLGVAGIINHDYGSFPHYVKRTSKYIEPENRLKSSTKKQVKTNLYNEPDWWQGRHVDLRQQMEGVSNKNTKVYLGKQRVNTEKR